MNQRKDFDAAEVLYKEALELDAAEPGITRNYAIFLTNQRKDFDAAEVLHKKALELDTNDATNTGYYAIFLARQRKDYDAAEAMYKKALALDTSHTDNMGNYASFLAHQRKDYDAADSIFRKALELDPSHASNTGNCANFLAHQRKDYDAAEALYKKALELDPSDPDFYANLASVKLLRIDLHPVDAVPWLVKQVVTLSGRKAMQSTAEALLYGALHQELAPQGPDADMLARLKSLLAMDYERGLWDFDTLFAVTLPKLPLARQAFYRSLGAAVLDRSKVALLDGFADWQSLESVDPFAPFSTG